MWPTDWVSNDDAHGKTTLGSTASRSNLPTVDDRTKMQGFGKLALAVASVRDVATSLKNKKVKVRARGDTGQRHRRDMFIVEDVDKNWLRFFEVTAYAIVAAVLGGFADSLEPLAVRICAGPATAAAIAMFAKC